MQTDYIHKIFWMKISIAIYTYSLKLHFLSTRQIIQLCHMLTGKSSFSYENINSYVPSYNFFSCIYIYIYIYILYISTTCGGCFRHKVGACVTIYMTMIHPLMFDPCCLNVTGLFQKKKWGLRSFSEPLSSHPHPLRIFRFFPLPLKIPNI